MREAPLWGVLSLNGVDEGLGAQIGTPIGQAFGEWIKSSAHLGEFTLGVLLGALLTCLLIWIILRVAPQATTEWKEICKAKDREIKELKKELREKDMRIDKCHAEIGTLKKQLNVDTAA